MKNMPEVKLGIVAVSRDCFPITLSESRRKAVAAEYQGELYECPTVVESEKDMKKAAEFPDMVKKMAEMYKEGETYFVAWGDSDYKVLDTACKRYKIENPIKVEDYLDLAEAYKLMKGDNYTTGLKAATEEQEVDTAGLWHTAFDDANNTGKLLKKLVEKGWTPESYFEKIKVEK